MITTKALMIVALLPALILAGCSTHAHETGTNLEGECTEDGDSCPLGLAAVPTGVRISGYVTYPVVAESHT